MEEFDADVDETGRLILPPELVKQFGLNPGTKVRIGKNANGMHLRPPLTRLAVSRLGSYNLGQHLFAG